MPIAIALEEEKVYRDHHAMVSMTQTRLRRNSMHSNRPLTEPDSIIGSAFLPRLVPRAFRETRGLLQFAWIVF
jgi:hypothetical protein